MQFRGLALVICVWAGVLGASALEYPTNRELAQHLKDLEKGHRKLVRVESVAKSRGNQDVWLAELGAGSDAERRRRPALLLAAGLEGNDFAGTAIAVAWIEHLAKSNATNEVIRKLLESTTLYIFPRVNPDASGRFFAKPKVELTVSRQPVDDDHDGLVDEDGPDDLNADGLITSMRVEDREGEYIADPAEPRLLLKADKAKGEVGAWRLLTEGRDNDGDEAWNEDGPGGVNFNRNFPYNYRFFEPWSGLHQVSESETRTLADFIVEHPNIGIVFTYGAADNLVQTPSSESKGEGPGRRPPTIIHKDDLPYYRELGKAYRDALGLKKELKTVSEPGTFSDWMYFHRGRLSLAAQPWSPALQLELAKSKTKEGDKKAKETGAAKEEKTNEKKEEAGDAQKPDEAKKPSEPGKPEPDKRNEEERAFLKWIDENAKELFVPWKSVEHPDFPGKKVEIGGLAPFARSNPPEKLLEPLAEKQGKFLTDLAGKLPRVSLRQTKVKHLGESIYDVTVQVENSGYLLTSLAQGDVSNEVNSTRVVLDVEPGDILSGSKRTMLGPIEGSGGMKEVRFVIRAKGRSQIEVEIISMLGGSVHANIDLKKEQ